MFSKFGQNSEHQSTPHPGDFSGIRCTSEVLQVVLEDVSGGGGGAARVHQYIVAAKRLPLSCSYCIILLFF